MTTAGIRPLIATKIPSQLQRFHDCRTSSRPMPDSLKHVRTGELAKGPGLAQLDAMPRSWLRGSLTCKHSFPRSGMDG
eukprot:72393-Alexandrium_andersonii.AAC.1